MRPGLILLLLLAALAQDLGAQTVTAEGLAPVPGNTLEAARAAAIRNALSAAISAAPTSVSSTAATDRFGLSVDQTLVRSEARVRRHEILHESHDGELYRVLISAELEPQGGNPAARGEACTSGHTKRLLIGGFPLLRPEELGPDELDGYAHLSAREIAARMDAQAPVLVDHKGALMLRLSLPERVTTDIALDQQSWTRIRGEAAEHRAQYILVGQFRKFSLDARGKRRTLELDALLIDAMSGACVARRRFAANPSGSVIVAREIRFGSDAHLRTALGKAYDGLLKEVAEWAATTTSCLPFGARIVRTDDDRIYLDAGAEHGIRVGDAFTILRARAPAVTSAGGEVLGEEKLNAGQATVIAVYPRFSVAQAPTAVVSTLRPGDELYSY